MDRGHLLDCVDGEAGQGVGHGVGLQLANGLQSAGLVLDVHVAEPNINNVEAETEKQRLVTPSEQRNAECPKFRLVQGELKGGRNHFWHDSCCGVATSLPLSIISLLISNLNFILKKLVSFSFIIILLGQAYT